MLGDDDLLDATVPMERAELPWAPTPFGNAVGLAPLTSARAADGTRTNLRTRASLPPPIRNRAPSPSPTSSVPPAPALLASRLALTAEPEPVLLGNDDYILIDSDDIVSDDIVSEPTRHQTRVRRTWLTISAHPRIAAACGGFFALIAIASALPGAKPAPASVAQAAVTPRRPTVIALPPALPTIEIAKPTPVVAISTAPTAAPSIAPAVATTPASAPSIATTHGTKAASAPSLTARRTSVPQLARHTSTVPAPAHGMGALMISAKPPCEIVVDGKPTHRSTPQRALQLAPGKHRITLLNASMHIHREVDIQITANQSTKVIQDLLKR